MEKDIKSLLEFGKRISTYEGNEIDVNQLSYAYVKNDFLEMAENGELYESVIECLKQLFKITEDDIKTLSNNYILGVFSYLYDQILTEKGIIFIQENTFLKSKPDPKMIASGQSMLEPFAYKHTLLHLAKGNILDMDHISKMPYGEILDIQVINKRESEIKDNYSEIIKNQK